MKVVQISMIVNEKDFILLGAGMVMYWFYRHPNLGAPKTEDLGVMYVSKVANYSR